MKYIKQLKNRLYPKKLLTRSVYIVFSLLSVNFIILTILLYSNHWNKIRYKLALGIFNNFYYITETVNSFQSITETQNLLIKASYFDLSMKIIPQENIISNKYSINNAITQTLNRLLKERYHYKNYQIVMVKKPILKLKQIVSPEYDIYIYYHSKFGWIETKFNSSLVSSSSVAVLSTVMILLSIALTIFATIATNRQLMPLKQLARASRSFGKGEQVEDLRIKGASEIRIAALSFNKMKNDIESYIQQKNLLLGAISHDLKTPITKIKLMLSIEENITIKKELNNQLMFMDDIINSYLSLLSEEITIREYETVNVHQIIENLINQVKQTLNKKPVLKFNISHKTLIKAHVPSLLRALYNLVHNAYSHAENCQIIVEKGITANNIYINVDDNGKGVSKDNVKSIFLPFFKEKTARTQSTTNLGSGLGLAIVKEIIKKHKGKVFYKYNSSLYGARFTVLLPIKKNLKM